MSKYDRDSADVYAVKRLGDVTYVKVTDFCSYGERDTDDTPQTDCGWK